MRLKETTYFKTKKIYIGNLTIISFLFFAGIAPQWHKLLHFVQWRTKYFFIHTFNW